MKVTKYLNFGVFEIFAWISLLILVE